MRASELLNKKSDISFLNNLTNFSAPQLNFYHKLHFRVSEKFKKILLYTILVYLGINRMENLVAIDTLYNEII